MTLKSTGYQAGVATITFSGTQTLASLADDEFTNLSDEIDNSTDKYVLRDFSLNLAAVAFTGANSQVHLYIVPSIDDTNYPNWTGNVTTDEQENEQYLAGSFTTSGANEAQEIILRDVRVPPGKYKVGLRNKSGVAFAATGNTLEHRPHSFEDV